MAKKHKKRNRAERIQQRSQGAFNGGGEREASAFFYDGYKAMPLTGRDTNAPTLYSYSTFGIPHLQRGRIKDDVYGRAVAALASEYAFNCIRLVATDISGIPFKVRDKQGKKELPDHPLMYGLHNARVWYQQDVIPLWQFQRYIFGEVFSLPEQSVYGVTNCLRLLNPIAVQKFIPSGRLESFRYLAPGGMWEFCPDEIAFDKVSNPLDDINGLSPVSIALDAISLDKEAKRYAIETLTKDMRMSGILTARQGGGVNAKDVDRVVEELNRQSDRRLIGLPWQLEYKQVQQNIDSSQLALSEDARRRIAAALGIPMSVAGAWDSATFQSAPAQIDHYYNSVIFPELRRHTLFMNEFVMPFFDRSGTAEAFYDTSEVDSMLDDKEQKANLYGGALKGGGITINEYRQKIGEKPTPDGDVYMIPAGVTLVATGQLKGGLTTGSANPLAPKPAALPQPPKPDTAKDVTGMKSACVFLHTPSHPDLIGLQNAVKEYMGDAECNWVDPATFHVTLISFPAVTDQQISDIMKTLDTADIPEMLLNVGSLNTFDTGTNFAVHFRVRRNNDLYGLQESLADLCDERGLPYSTFSDPENYTPHITMAYSKAKLTSRTFNSKIMLKPMEVHLSVGDNTVYRKAIGKPESAKPMKPAAAGKGITEEALRELAAWQKKVKNHDKTKPFKTYLIRDEIGSRIRDGLAAAETPEAIKTVFEQAQEALSIKAIQATRIDFEDQFEDILNDAIAGLITRRQWSARTRTLIQTFAYKAYVDGLADAGVYDEPGADEMTWLNTFISDQSTYVTNLGNTLFKSDTEISSDMAAQKPSMWFNGSVYPAYSEGLLSGDANGVYEWVLGNAEKHCTTCPQLNGQTKRYKTWDKLNLIAGTVGQDTECQGFNCDCKLVRVARKSTPGDLLTLLAGVEHVHAHVA